MLVALVAIFSTSSRTRVMMLNKKEPSSDSEGNPPTPRYEGSPACCGSCVSFVLFEVFEVGDTPKSWILPRSRGRRASVPVGVAGGSGRREKVTSSLSKSTFSRS